MSTWRHTNSTVPMMSTSRGSIKESACRRSWNSFGDAINDLEMLQCVGHPVVVDNCVPELKTFGFEQTDDVLDEGFYNYCVSHKLIKAL